MALLTLLPFYFVCACLVLNHARSQRVLIEAQLRAVTDMAAAAAHVVVTEWRSGLELLAQVAGDSSDIQAAARAMSEYLDTHPETQALGLLRSDSSVAAQSGRLPDGAVSAAAAAMSLPESLAAESRVTDFLRLEGANGPLIAVAVPLRQGPWAGGSLLALNDASMMNMLSVPDDARHGWQAAIVDENNTIIADTNSDLVGQVFPLTRETDRHNFRRTSVFNVVLGGVDSYVAMRHSASAPWFVTYVVPSELFDVRRQSEIEVATFLALLAMPFMGSGLLGRYLGRRMGQLAENAASVSSEQVPAYLPPTGLSEIDVVQQALQHAGEAVQERAVARQRLQDMEVVLRRAERIESLGQLTAAISHDFGNLIFTIRGNLEIIQRKLRGNEEMQQIIARPLRLADEAAALISQLSAGVRHKRNCPECININNVLSDVAGLLREVAGRGIRVQINPGAGLFDCRLDPILLKSALLNLVVNARNAMPSGGKIEIHSQNVALSKQAAKAAALAGAGDYVTLSVADTGTGIPPEIRARIFEPFFTTREDEAGTGIGLSILHGFVTASGGSVRVHSTMGEGTIFTLHFPAEPFSSDTHVADVPQHDIVG
jgi:signal transduction histidine kinase